MTARRALTAGLLRAWDESGCDYESASETLLSLSRGGGAGGTAAGFSAAADATKFWRQRLAAVVCVAVAGAAFCLHDAIAQQVMAERCIISNNVVLMEMTRPVVDCDMCSRLDGAVPAVEQLAPDEFLHKYAYTGVPVLIRGGARAWSALQVFNFDFFKKLYTETPGAISSIQRECQFFPYQTQFSSMAEVFNMSAERQRLGADEERWYVGWSNCHPIIKEELRKHYSRPHFLPNDSESSSQDWIFMGGFGGGAYLHIDYVKRPSWQAMISGKKTWTLVPSPECRHRCQAMNVTMETGDILVIDTNMWYHKTYIHPGEVSITIGSEYD